MIRKRVSILNHSTINIRRQIGGIKFRFVHAYEGRYFSINSMSAEYSIGSGYFTSRASITNCRHGCNQRQPFNVPGLLVFLKVVCAMAVFSQMNCPASVDASITVQRGQKLSFNKLSVEDQTRIENSEGMKKAMLQHLGLDYPPTFSWDDFESLQIPNHVRTKYDNLKLKHDQNHRAKRSSLAGLFQSVHQNPVIPGDIVYTDPYQETLEFEMEGRIPTGTVVTMAELRLFKTLPDFESNLWIDTDKQRRYRNIHPSAFLRNHPGRYMKPVRHARVSIYHTLLNPDGTTIKTLVDSRKIHVNGSGWQAFDVTDAVHQWQLHPTRIMSMTLEMWIEGTRPGRHAANVAKLVRFTRQKENDDGSGYRPELIVFTEEERSGGSRSCKKDSNPQKRKCCRENFYINFREMEWTQYWILEPSGYEAFRCDGKCATSRRRGREGLPRSCSVAESAPLPVMYMVKRGDVTEVEVTEFPNMVVKRCGCSLDSVFLS